MIVSCFAAACLLDPEVTVALDFIDAFIERIGDLEIDIEGIAYLEM
jgi:hypothetical protein